MAGDFKSQIDAWIGKVDQKLNLFVRKVALDMFTRISQRTPVLTGRAVTNWMVAKGTPITISTTDADPTGTQAMQAAMSVFATYDWKVDANIFITNSVPYIMPLEHGHSKKAPNGMVKVTVAEFQDVIQAQLL